MTVGTDRWVEFTLTAPTGLHDDILIGVVGPFVRKAVANSTAARGIFLRGLGRSERTKLIIALETPAPADRGTVAPGLLADLSAAAEEAGACATARPGAPIPLVGPVFSGPALEPVTRHFCAEVTSTLLHIVETAVANPADRLNGALDIMTAHLPAVGNSAPGTDGFGTVPLAFVSFRSHAEAFIASSRDPDVTRRALQRRYDAVQPTVEGRVADVLAQLRGAGPAVSPSAGDWYQVVRVAKPTMVAHFRAGRIVAKVPPTGVALNGNEFHRTVESSPELRRFLQDDPAFLGTRLLTSLLYLSLHNIGISLAERYLLCYCIGRACESLFNLDAVEALTLIDGRIRECGRDHR